MRAPCLPGRKDVSDFGSSFRPIGVPFTPHRQVRAPLPVVTERLYGEEAHRPGPRRTANPVPQNVVDAFRNFKWVLPPRA